MNTTKWLGSMAAVMLPLSFGCAQVPESQFPAGAAPGQATLAVPNPLSPAAAQIVTLAEAGTSDDVILAYIQNSQAAFNLSADQILYLRDIGVSSPAITAMLNRDNVLRGQAAYPPTAPPPASPVPEPVPQTAPPPPAEAPPPDYVSTPPPDVGYFYSGLSPYGTWVQLGGIGWCWQPRVVVINRAWRPYCDSGHWVWTDAGWYWHSDYSWGWAPFHYGRWQLHERCGWVWLPDRVWGPAWVTWRTTGDHCGWAPLPPHADFDVHFGWRFNGVSVGVNFDFGLRPEHFAFVALRDFNERDLGHRRLPPAEVTRVYQQTTIINNYTVNHNTIVNQGIQVERVAAATHTQIRKVAIRDVPADSPQAHPAPTSARTDAVVYRPQLKAPATPVHMVAQRIDERHPDIQHPAIVPVKTESRPIPPGKQLTAPGVPRRPQPQTPGTPARPAPYPSPAYPYSPAGQPVQTTPSAPVTRPLESPKYRSAPITTTLPDPNARSTPPRDIALSTPAPAPARVAAQPTPAARPPATYQPGTAFAPRSIPAPSHIADAPKQSARPTTTFQPDTTFRPSPGATAPRPAAAQTALSSAPAQNQNPHFYLPKSAHQAAEAHALPPLNSRAGPPPSSSPNSPASPSKKGES